MEDVFSLYGKQLFGCCLFFLLIEFLLVDNSLEFTFSKDIIETTSVQLILCTTMNGWNFLALG